MADNLVNLTLPSRDGKSSVEIIGLPESLKGNRDVLMEMYKTAEGSNRSNISYSEYYQAKQAGEKKAEARPEGSPTSLSGSPEQKEQITPGDPAPPKTTFKGLTDPIVKELGPTAIAGMIGFAVAGPVGAGIGMGAVALTDLFSPHIAKFLNEKLGTDQISSQEMADKAADILALEKPDTPAEEIFASGARGVKEAAQFVGLTLATGGSNVALQAPSKVQAIGRTLASNPLQQIVGSGVSAIGAESASIGAEAADLGPIQTMVAEMGGAILGDMTGSGVVDIAKKAQKLMIAKNMDMPSAIQEVLDMAKGRVDMIRSDFPRQGIDAQDRRNMGEGIRGVRDLRSQQATQRQEMITDLTDSFGDIDGTFKDKLKSVANDFFEKRDADFTQASGNKNEVLNRLSTDVGTEVDTTKTVEAIDDYMSQLIEDGNSDMQPLINKLANWKEMVQGKKIETIERHRRAIGDAYKSPDMQGIITSDDTKVNSIYSSLREEMGEYIKENGEMTDFNKWDDAMGELSDLSKDFKTKGISEIMKSEDAPIEAMGNALFRDPDIAKSVYEKLPTGAQENARGAFLSKMIKDSSDLGDVSPNEFARKLDDYEDQYKVLFPEQNTGHIGAIQKLLEKTKRAEHTELLKEILPGENIPGGTYGMARLIAKNPAVGIPAVLGTLAGRSALIKKMEQPPLRDLLIKYDQIPVSEVATEGAELLKRIGEVMRGYLGAEDAEEKLNRNRGAE